MNHAKTCAFCAYSGKMSAEHIVSQWIADLLPGKKNAMRTDHLQGTKTHWPSLQVDYKACVVCANCNTSWMSNIESQVAKPVIGPLIQGKIGMNIGPSEARSIAVFAFKTAVLLDHANRRGEISFYRRRVRYGFRESLVIPDTINIWVCAQIPGKRSVRVESGYYNGDLIPGRTMQLYVATVGLGYFGFQVVSSKRPLPFPLLPLPGFGNIAAPIWPIPLNFGLVWPPPDGIRTGNQFDQFRDRWSRILAVTD